MWLDEHGLGQYKKVIVENDIDADALVSLTNEDLKDLGVASLGHRKKFLRALAELRPDPTGAAKIRQPADDARLHQPGDEPELRQVTVLFCDLVGSTALSAALGPEDMRNLLRGYQDACAGAIARYGGYVAKFMGDGVYAYFGYPRAHEDDAERAVNAGLGIVRAIHDLGEARGRALAVRIGVATGVVAVGDIIGEGSAQEAVVVGDTPNLAARLQECAAPDAVIIDANTHRIAGGLFDCAALGERALKGIARPAALWQVSGSRKIESRFETVRGGQLTAFVGREEERAILLKRWERAKGGDGQVVVISGEPGIGKSRLARELGEHIKAEPHTRLRYQCSPYHTASALYPVIEQLERAARLESGDDTPTKLDKIEAVLARSGLPVAEAAPLFASLLSVPFEDRYGPLALSPQRQKVLTLQALTNQLLGLASAHPVFFVFEDVHWIDPTSLELLDATVRAVASANVLVVVTCRPNFIMRWSGPSNVTLLPLNRLRAEHCSSLAESVTGGKELPEVLRKQIIEKTDGVPLFIEEVTKSVLESGILREEGGQFVLGEAGAGIAVPATLQDSLEARLDRLAVAKEIAQIGAAIGREFRYELIAAVSPLQEDATRSALDDLVRAGLVYRRGRPPNVIFSFKHALVQDTAYASLLRSRRAEIHAKIAGALDRHFPEIAAGQPELVAHHLTEAGRIEPAILHWQKAGQNAARRFANAEAIAHFSRAIDLLQTLADGEARRRQELSLQINVAPVYQAAKGFSAPEAERAYLRARELAIALGDETQRFIAEWGLWLVNQMQAKKGTALKLAEDLVALSARNVDSGLTLQAHHASWTTNFFTGAFEATRKHAERGRALYDPTEHRAHKFLFGGHDPGVCCRNFEGISLLALGYPDRALASAMGTIEMAEALQHPLSLILCVHFATYIRLLRNDFTDAAALVDRAVKLATEHGIPRGLWEGVFRGWSLGNDGEPQARLAMVRADLSAVGAAGTEGFRPLFLGAVAEIAGRACRGEQAVAAADDAIAYAEGTDSDWCLADLHRIRGEALDGADRRGDAAGAFEDAIRIARAQSAKFWELRAATALARLRAEAGRRQDARALLAPVYDWFTEGFDTADLKRAKALLDALD